MEADLATLSCDSERPGSRQHAKKRRPSGRAGRAAEQPSKNERNNQAFPPTTKDLVNRELLLCAAELSGRTLRCTYGQEGVVDEDT